jgi:iron complex transport system substrate-binding protein
LASIVAALLLVFSIPLHAQRVTRIVSLAQSLTQNIYYLDAQDMLVGCTSFCKEAIADKKDIVASAISVNVEQVVLHKPDLVVATELTNPETIELLRKFKLRVVVFPKVHSFKEICEQFVELGRMIGREQKAQDIAQRAKERVSAIAQMASPKGEQPKIFFQLGTKPLFAVIPNTFMDDYITLLGGKNIAHDFTMPSITRESVVARNPDIIIIVSMGMAGDEEMQAWKSYKTLNACKSNRIFFIDSDKACTPTPISFVQTLETLMGLAYN